MKTRRELILKELGLTPVWRIKSSPLRQDSIQPSQTQEVTQSRQSPVEITVDQAPQSTIRHMDWNQLKSEVAHCQACPLSQTRTQTVFGVGDEHADWLYVGEGPGATEDEVGEPFVGQAGKLLDNMLAAIDLKRGYQVYITNIVKCRPPNNRNPSLHEANQCRPYLTRQIELIKPKIIVALGKVAAQNLLGREDSISSLRGIVHNYSGIPLIVTYHPAYLLRSLPEKAKVWKDLCFAKATLQSLP